MAEHEPQNFESCAVCGRTILRGERTTEYASADGARHRVCTLCKGRAEAEGWIPAEHAGAHARPAQRRRRGVVLRTALSRAAERVRQPRPEPAPKAGGERARQPASDATPRERPQPRREPEPPAPQEREPASGAKRAGPKPRPARRQPRRRTTARESKRGAAAAREGGERQTRPAQEKAPSRRPKRMTAERRLRRAVEGFNASDEARVVAGLIRSLGEPSASLETISARPPRVAITIAWELSWYRWEVSDDGDAVSVREVAKGGDVDELTDAAKQWNAAVDADGRLQRVDAAAPHAGGKASG